MKQQLNCILLIDDDEPTNFLNKMVIEEAGIARHILVEQSAEDALDYLQGKMPPDPGVDCPIPDLIFLDINMPAMDGWEFLDRYKQLPADQQAAIIVVMLTTSFNPEDEVKARSIGLISEFRNKPLNPRMLLDIIREHFPERF
ncbi:MAG: response regulator [Candidatus Pseudobacter hemicellulosilyticus]|uniref:Response regulator n=1 Tax=Candidatus Pseudobacter hemicellulosilyticus TaxID=3121375 RepID=A0AAJ5WP62_9BACT|nr:MAG: response regulator [Pseudobacter sp.]